MKDKRALKKGAGVLPTTFLMLSLLVAPSRAQEGPDQPNADVKLKSESTAVMLSAVGTLVPLALASLRSSSPRHESGASDAILAASMLVGPSLGYFYAGLVGRGFVGLGVRAIGLAGLIGGLSFLLDEMNKKPALGVPLLLGGGALFFGSMFCDLAKVREAVRKRNDRIRNASLNIAPVLSPRSKTVGLSLQLGF
jgi:hypothetical protein